MRGICRGLAGLSLALPLMAASTASAQVCGTNGTLTNLEVLALTGSQQQQLLCFRENSPQNTRVIGTVTGLRGGETLVGIDFRTTGVLLGLSSQGNVYTLNQQTAAATLLTPLLVNGQTVQIQGNAVGFDENPTSSALRIFTAGANPQNIRQPNQANGQFPAAVIDGVVNVVGAPANSPAPQGISSAAYTNVDATPGTGTVLYGIDTTANTLVLFGVPNAGTESLVGPLGADIDANTSFDIFTLVARGNTVQVNRALASSQAPNQTATTYEIDLDTGLASDIRNFQAGVNVIGIAIPTAQAGNPAPTQPGN